MAVSTRSPVRVGAPTIHLDSELETALEAREERLAHYTGLEDFRGDTVTDDGFWDEDALGE